MSRSHSRDEKLTLTDLFHRYQALYDLTRPIVIFNSDTIDIHAYVLPPELLEAAAESPEKIQRAIATSDEVALMSLDQYQKKDFDAGLPILIGTDRFEHRVKRESGGQTNDKLEIEIKSALACTTYSGIEHMRHLFFIRNKIVYRSTQESRDVVIEYLAKILARKEHTKIDEEHYQKHLNTLWDKGKRSENWKKYFAVENLSKSIKHWNSNFSKLSKKEIDYEIDFQVNLIRSLMYCESRATNLRKTIHLVSDNAASNINEDANQRDQLAAITPDQKHSFSDVLPAAFCGDINPSDLFLSLKIFRSRFNTMRIIGRFYRGMPAEFTHSDMIILRDAFRIRAEWEKVTEKNKINGHAFWVIALDSIMPSDGWQRLYKEGCQAIKYGEKFIVQRDLN